MRFAAPIVAQVDPSRIWGGRAVPLAVGLVPWGPREERTTVVVKARYEVGLAASLADRQPKITRARPASRRGAWPIEVDAPDDLVRAKLACDVLLAGSAYAERAVPRIDARLKVGDALDLRFAVVGPSPIERMPLAGEFLRAPDGATPIPPVGPVRAREVVREERAPSFDELDEADRAEVLAELRRRFELLEAIDAAMRSERDADAADGAPQRIEDPGWDSLPRASNVLDDGVQFAAAHLTMPFPEGGEVLELEGLTPGGGPRSFALPTHVPLVLADGQAGRLAVAMELDTMLLDDEGLTLTWRGQVPADLFASPTSFVLVCLAERGREPSVATLMGELARAHFARAVVPEEASLPEARLPDVELAAQRARWSFATPAPMLPLEAYARLRAELGARPELRGALLERHGLDEHEWSLEVRAYAALLERAEARGDHATAAATERALAAARQDARMR